MVEKQSKYGLNGQVFQYSHNRRYSLHGQKPNEGHVFLTLLVINAPLINQMQRGIYMHFHNQPLSSLSCFIEPHPITQWQGSPETSSDQVQPFYSRFTVFIHKHINRQNSPKIILYQPNMECKEKLLQNNNYTYIRDTIKLSHIPQPAACVINTHLQGSECRKQNNYNNTEIGICSLCTNNIMLND